MCMGDNLGGVLMYFYANFCIDGYTFNETIGWCLDF